MLGTRGPPDIQTNDGAPPLCCSPRRSAGAKGRSGCSGQRANPNLPNRQGETPLIYAVRRFDAPMVRLLMSNGADPNQTDSLSGNSALDYARQDRRGQGG